MLSETSRRNLLRFCARETDPRAFESWVCGAQDLEGEIGHGPYVDLVCADYKGRDVSGARELCEKLLDQHHPGSLARCRVRRVLRSMLEEESAIVAGLRRLVALRNEGHDFIPIAFVGFDSETDDVPTADRYPLWNAAALAELQARTRPYFKHIQQACRELLDHLERHHPDEV
jgi:hypothetical protein